MQKVEPRAIAYVAVQVSSCTGLAGEYVDPETVGSVCPLELRELEALGWYIRSCPTLQQYYRLV